MKAIREADWYDQAAPPVVKLSPHRVTADPFGLGR